MNVLTIHGLEKSFGTQQIIKNLNLSVPEGTIFGFIGQNGAGKTTTMKMVLGLLEADSGEILVCGERVQFGQTKTNQHIGYLPDVPEFYNYMNCQQYLALCGAVTGLSTKEMKRRSSELLQLVGLKSVTKKIGSFSRGMKQRLGIAQALLSRPKLLICDEPTSALDPVGRKEILDILQRIKGSTTVLFSTHILSDVERVCGQAAILHNGKIAVSGTLTQMKSKYGHDSLLLEFSAEEELKQFTRHKRMLALVDGLENAGKKLVLHSGNMKKLQQETILTLAETCICPIKMEFTEPSLESLFLEVIK